MDEARSVLARVARSHVDGSGTSEERHLVLSAAACMVGVGFEPRAEERDARPPWAWFESIQEQNSTYSSEFLDALRSRFTQSADVLFEVAECLKATPSISGLTALPALMEDGRMGGVTARHSAERPVPSGPAVKLFLSSALMGQAARQRAAERVTVRLIYWASGAGMTQRDISRLVAKPQTAVYRHIQAVRDDPAAFALDPEELYANHVAGNLDRQTLIELLAAYPYQQGLFPEDAPDWGYVPGSWDQLTRLVINGSISEEELDVIIAGHEMIAAKHE
ncbi:hypothetical protein [Rathayibacter sp. PhB152]|uniref:hypothetical protein n=1 Tax=Rathayibacter sp. PhB152 TaxID=2485190 RepID=UPI0011CE9B9C|nr:hypothetical protein [Rathayibacter sp. PhB152]